MDEEKTITKHTDQSAAMLAMAAITFIALAFAGYAGIKLYGQDASTDTQSSSVPASSVSASSGPGIDDVSKPVDQDIAAWVNQHPITVDYVNQQIASLPVGQQTALLANMEKFVESLIQEETLFKSMLGDEFNQEPDMRDSVKTQVVNFLIDKYVTNGVEVTDDMIKTYYDNNQSTIREEHVAASHIVLANKDECEVVIKDIDSLESFRQLARDRSIDESSARNGGDIGLFMNHSGELGFEEAMFDMPVGEMQLFESDKGCHIVRVTDHVIPPMPPLDQVKDRITELLIRRERGVALQALLRRSEQGVVVKRGS